MTLLEHQVAALESAGASTVVVVLGHQREKLEPLLRGRPGVCLVRNPHYRMGKTTSIKAGLSAIRAGGPEAAGGPGDPILLLNVDQPRSPETVRRIVELHCASARGSRPVLITVPTYGGRGGHPVVLASSLIPELAAITEETLGLKAVISRHRAETQRVEVDSPEVLLDLNSPQDYRAALAAMSPE
jgi:molybdenum cofactor cytidylyltransferase